MKKNIILVILIVFFGVGCAFSPPVPLSELPPVRLCYELVTSNQKKSVEVYAELQRRGEDCQKYQQQVAMMIEKDNQQRAATAAYFSNQANSNNTNQKTIEELYWAPQRALQLQPTVSCTTQQSLGSTVYTKCR
jgi:hypothetical protein